MKKHVTLLLLLAMLLSAFASCTGDSPETTPETPAETQPVETEETEAELTANLPDVNYDGYTFTLMTLNNYGRGYIADEMTGEPLNDAIFESNNKVCEVLGIQLEYVEVGDENGQGVAVNALRNALAAGDTTYDWVFPHPTAGLINFIVDGMLYNVYDLPVVDFSKPWWNTNAMEAMSVGDKAYFMAGDYAVPYQGMLGLCFNKELMDDLGIEEDLYSLTWEGKWTADVLYSMMEKATMDVNGDGIMDAEDRFGLITNGFYDAWQYGFGQGMTTRDENGFPVPSIHTERMYSIVETVYQLYNSDACYVTGYVNATFPVSDFYKIVLEGDSLFFTFDVGGLYGYLRDIDYNFGILPLPKLDEQQESYGILTGSGLSGIPINATDLERTGAVMEAICYYSYVYLRPVFFDTVLENKSVRDEDSYKVLELMHESKHFDFAFNMDPSGVLNNIAYNVVQKKNSTDLASYLASIESKITSSFEKIKKQFAE